MKVPSRTQWLCQLKLLLLVVLSSHYHEKETSTKAGMYPDCEKAVNHYLHSLHHISCAPPTHNRIHPIFNPHKVGCSLFLIKLFFLKWVIRSDWNYDIGRKASGGRCMAAAECLERWYEIPIILLLSCKSLYLGITNNFLMKIGQKKG